MATTPVRIKLYDTTLRDGAQAEGVSFSLNDKLSVAYRLDDFGIDFIEGGYPASNEKDEAFFERVAEKSPKSAIVCAFGMTRRKGVKPTDDAGLAKLVGCGAPIVTIVGKSSAFQATDVLCVSLEENLAMIDETIQYAVSLESACFTTPNISLTVGSLILNMRWRRCELPFALGAEVVVLCDTNGGSMPDSIERRDSSASLFARCRLIELLNWHSYAQRLRSRRR